MLIQSSRLLCPASLHYSVCTMSVRLGNVGKLVSCAHAVQSQTLRRTANSRGLLEVHSHSSKAHSASHHLPCFIAVDG